MCSQTLNYTHVTGTCPVRGSIRLGTAASSAGCCGPSASFLDHPLLPRSCPGQSKEQVSGNRKATGCIANSDSSTLPHLTAGFLGSLPAHLVTCPIPFPLNICNKQWDTHLGISRSLMEHWSVCLQLLADTTEQTQKIPPLISPPGSSREEKLLCLFLGVGLQGLGPVPASHWALTVKISFGRTNQECNHPLSVLFLRANISQ